MLRGFVRLCCEGYKMRKSDAVNVLCYDENSRFFRSFRMYIYFLCSWKVDSLILLNETKPNIEYYMNFLMCRFEAIAKLKF